MLTFFKITVLNPYDLEGRMWTGEVPVFAAAEMVIYALQKQQK